jgi:hypothetical protein
MSSTAGQRVVVGQGDYQYEVALDWPKLPGGWSFVEATAVAADAEGRALVFNRGEHPVIVLDAHGEVISHWGEGEFVRPHGITITADGTVWLVDDMDHTLHKYSLDGQRQFTLGTSGQPSDTGATSTDYRTIQRAGPPFHYPTNLAVAPNGELFIADGYGNARIHKFTAGGELLLSWGEPGDGPGQFHIPHGIAVDSNGVVYVADRENSRIQRFDSDGSFIDEWCDLARPCQMFLDSDDVVYVAEVGYRAGMWPGTEPPAPDATGGRVSILDTNGELLSRWGGGDNPGTPGDFFAPHDIWVDAAGTIYVAEVSWSAGGKKGLVPADIPSLHKFVRIKP